MKTQALLFANLLTAAREVHKATGKGDRWCGPLAAPMAKLLAAVEVFDAPKDDKPELGEFDRVVWGGYNIKRKLDFPMPLADSEPEKVGYVVTKGGCNIMPGAAWFKTVAEAQKGIAAFVLANRIRPLGVCAATTVPKIDGELFWMLMELTK